MGVQSPGDRFHSYDSYCWVFNWDLLLFQSYLKALHISVCRVPPPDVANSPPVNVRHSRACTSTCPNWTCGANMAAPSPSQDVNSMWILITDRSQDLVGSWISLWSSRQIKNKIPSPSWVLQTSSLPLIFGTMKKPKTISSGLNTSPFYDWFLKGSTATTTSSYLFCKAWQIVCLAPLLQIFNVLGLKGNHMEVASFALLLRAKASNSSVTRSKTCGNHALSTHWL